MELNQILEDLLCIQIALLEGPRRAAYELFTLLQQSATHIKQLSTRQQMLTMVDLGLRVRHYTTRSISNKCGMSGQVARITRVLNGVSLARELGVVEDLVAWTWASHVKLRALLLLHYRVLCQVVYGAVVDVRIARFVRLKTASDILTALHFALRSLGSMTVVTATTIKRLVRLVLRLVRLI